MLGYCGIGDAGHLASLCAPGCCGGQGIGKSLLAFALAAYPEPTTGRYRAEASAFSLPRFQRCGFQLLGHEQVMGMGSLFERFLVATNAVDES